jgi:ribosomal protein S26
LGYIFKEAAKNDGLHYFLVCDNCGFEIDTLNVFCVTKYKEKRGWITLFNNLYTAYDKSWKVKELCNSCAKALGYIKVRKGEELNER